MHFNEVKQIILRQPNIQKRGSALAEPFLGKFTLTETTRVERLDVQTGTFTTAEFDALRREEDVASIAPSVPVQLIHPLGEAQTVTQTDATTWGIRAIKADASPYSGEGVVIAVLDTGIDITHPAFHGVEIRQKDFTGEGDGDGNGHGTHVAGTIFGRDVDGSRIGVARGVRQVLIGKVLDSSGSGETGAVMAGLQWAINEGAHVISMSLGISFPHIVEALKAHGLPDLAATSLGLEAYRANIRMFDAILELMEAHGKLMDHPVVLVAAAGNESNIDGSTHGEPAYRIFTAPPAAADGAISVGAVDEEMRIAPFSNTRASLVAPGVDIVSAWPGGGLKSLQGTSMAAPHVAGLAALYAEMLIQEGSFTVNTFSANVIANAEHGPLADPFETIDVGAGLAQAPAAAINLTGLSVTRLANASYGT